jgi:hypothetical protein
MLIVVTGVIMSVMYGRWQNRLAAIEVTAS